MELPGPPPSRERTLSLLSVTKNIQTRAPKVLRLGPDVGRNRPGYNSDAMGTRGEADSSLLQAMSDAVLAMAAEPGVERVLRKLVDSARELVDARYAAIGIPDDAGVGFTEFIYAGMSDEMVAKIGPLPRRHASANSEQEEMPYSRTDRTQSSRRFPRRSWR